MSTEAPPIHNAAVAGNQAIMANAMREMTQNTTMMRQEILRRVMGYGAEKRMDEECGYPQALTPWDYRTMYDREAVPNRVVSVLPEECWSELPEIYETEDSEETEFEKAWKKLNKERNVLHYLQRMDEVSGIGCYGVMLLGVDDGKELNLPIDGVNEDGTYSDAPKERKLLFMRPFDEYLAPISKFEDRTNNPRFGLPTEYLLKFTDPRATGPTAQSQEMVASKPVHWSRVIHVADNRKCNEWCGVPRMQVVWNRLHDLRKVLGGSAEMFWKGGFPGYSIEVLPEVAAQGIKIDTDAVKEQIEQYLASLQRFLALTGVTVKSLAPQVETPKDHLDAQYNAIAMCIGVPVRVFLGTEEAVKAGDQDKVSWNKRLHKRQVNYLTPMLVRPTFDRLIGIGCLPKPGGSKPATGKPTTNAAGEEVDYCCDWKDLNTPSDKEKAEVAKNKTEAMSTYVSGGVDTLMAPMHYLTHILGFSDDEAEAIIEDAQNHVDDTGGGITAAATAADIDAHPDAHPRPATAVPAGTPPQKPPAPGGTRPRPK